MTMPAHHPHARRMAAKAKAVQARRRFYAAIKEIDRLIDALPMAFAGPLPEHNAIADQIEQAVAPYVEAAARLPKPD